MSFLFFFTISFYNKICYHRLAADDLSTLPFFLVFKESFMPSLIRMILVAAFATTLPIAFLLADDPQSNELGDVADPKGVVNEEDVQRIFRLITGEYAVTDSDIILGHRKLERNPGNKSSQGQLFIHTQY